MHSRNIYFLCQYFNASFTPNIPFNNKQKLKVIGNSIQEDKANNTDLVLPPNFLLDFIVILNSSNNLRHGKQPKCSNTGVFHAMKNMLQK